MESTQKIDYSKFRIEVYSPDGALIKEAAINKEHLFYCPGLTPGQQYNIVFSYDGMFLLASAFTCNAAGKVALLNPAHFLFNAALSRPSKGFVNSVKGKVKTSRMRGVPMQLWEMKLLEIIQMSGNKILSPCLNSDGFHLFASGSDISAQLPNH